MADKGNLTNLKESVETVFNNAQSDGFITPQKHYNMVTDLIDTLAASYGDAVLNTDNEYDIAMSVTQVGLSEHKLYLVTFDITNTGAITLNVDELGDKSVVDSEFGDLLEDDIVVGKIYEVRYNSDNDVFVINV